MELNIKTLLTLCFLIITGLSLTAQEKAQPIFKNGEGIGRVTSGAYGYSVGMSLALGFVKNARSGDQVEVMVLGQPHKATILDKPPFDPKGERLRA